MAFSLKHLFLNKSEKASGRPDPQGSFSFLGTDMHSHLIPGIDDGSPDLSTSLHLIRQLKELGYHKLITTPHILQDYYPNSKAVILEGYHALKEAIDDAGLSVEILPAAEYFLDNHVMDLLKKEETLLTLSGTKLLVEFSLIAPPLHRDEFLFQLKVKGYDPVIAHIERYPYYHHKPDQYQLLYDKGYALQVNLLSFTGHYGKGVKKAALYLLDQRLVKYLGTDLHHQRHIEGLKDLCHDRKLMQKLMDYPWENDKL
jgi:tyrosine-protein phosphatase YwqE